MILTSNEVHMVESVSSILKYLHGVPWEIDLKLLESNHLWKECGIFHLLDWNLNF